MLKTVRSLQKMTTVVFRPAIRLLLMLLAVAVMTATMPAAVFAQESSSGVTITVTGRLALRLAFITPERSPQANQLSFPITVQVQTVSGKPYTLPSPATITLSTTSGTGRFFTDAAGTTQTSSVSIPAGASTATFYYRDITPGTYTITVSETPPQGWIAGTQNIYVTPAGGGGGGGPPPRPTPEPTPTPLIRTLTVSVFDQQRSLDIRSDGVALNTVTVSDLTRTAAITIEAGTRITAEGPDGVVTVPDRIEVVVAEVQTPPGPPPPGYILLSTIFDARAIIGGRIVPVSFDRPVTLVFNWDVLRYPNATDIFVAYYSRDRGWISVQPPPGYVAEYGQAAAQATHFTYYAVFGRVAPAPSPARFDIRNLTVFPKEVRVGESVTITATISNTGGMRGEYVVRLRIPGLLETFQTVNLAPRDTQQVRFTVVPGMEGVYTVELGDVGNFFTVTAAPSPPPARGFNWWLYLFLAAVTAALLLGIAYGATIPMRRRQRTSVVRRVTANGEMVLFKISDLTITPSRTPPGAVVTVIGQVANIGRHAGTCSLVLKVGGTAEALKEVSLSPGQKEKVAFTVLKQTPGTYEVELEGLRGRFTVYAPEVSTSAATDARSGS